MWHDIKNLLNIWYLVMILRIEQDFVSLSLSLSRIQIGNTLVVMLACGKAFYCYAG